MSLKAIFIILLVLALIAGAAFAFIEIFGDENTDEPNEPKEDTKPTEILTLKQEDFNFKTVNSSRVLLAASAPEMKAGTGITQTLTATVIPATASNKAVDWSVEWGDSARTDAVTDFVTVTPASNGSTTATVTCKQAFTGNIIVTVTTRESGYTAECIVSFVGKPTSIQVTSNLTQQSDGYHLGVGNTYTFNVTPQNPLGQVGASYKNMTVELIGVGSVILGYKEQNVSSGNISWYDTSNETVTLDSLKDNFITVNYSNGVVTVNTLKTVESYYSRVERLDSGRTRAYHDAFREYVGDAYFTVKITEPTSGVSEIIKIRFDETVVTGVSTSMSEMKF